MEEKERFELNDNDCIIDNEKDVAICDVCDVGESPKILVDLLNQQDKRIKELEEKHNQDKISFAVEQLTLFKNSIVNKMNNPYSVNIKHILSDFDNQIKSLKGIN